MVPVGEGDQESPTPTLLDRSDQVPILGNWTGTISMESLILAQDERWRRA